MVIKHSDSIHKVFAVSISIMLATFIYSGILFPHYMPINTSFFMGAMLVTISSITYFYLIEKKKYFYINLKEDTIVYDGNTSNPLSAIYHVLSSPINQRDTHMKSNNTSALVANSTTNILKSGVKRNTYSYGV